MIEHKTPTPAPGFPTKLVNLPDVDDTTTITGQVPVYNSGTSGFIIATLNAGNLGSLDLQNKTNGYALTWNATTNTLDLQAQASGVAWGGITGTLSDQTDLNTVLGSKAPLASPTFTGTVGGITASMVGLSNVDNTSDATKNAASVTLTNKTLDNTNAITVLDGSFTLQKTGATTKQAQFDLASVTAGQTRVIAVPDSNLTLVGTTLAQTLTNKTLDNTTSLTIKAANLTIQDGTDTDKQAKFVASSITSGQTRTITIPDSNLILVGTTLTQTLTNKTLDNTSTIDIKDTNFSIQDSSDANKKFTFRAASITSGQTRQITVPDVNITLVGTAATQTLTSKTLTKPTLQGYIDELGTPADGATITFDMAANNFHKVQIGGNRTLAVSNISVGQIFTLVIQQSIGGGNTISWFAGISWSGASAPVLTAGANKFDVFRFYCIDSGVYLGEVVTQNL